MEKINQGQDRVLCILQARMGSTRLPGKVLLKAKGVPLLEYELNRVKLAKKIDKIVVATTANKEDNVIEDLCKCLHIDCFRGSESDVLDRYYQCARSYPEFSSIVRITGDCPLIDPVVIDQVITLFIKGKYDYASNILQETFPDGMDIEVFTKKALEDSARNAKLQSEREHVTLYVRNNKSYAKGNLAAEHDFSNFRLTVDQKEDFEVVKFLIENCPADASYAYYASFLLKYPEVLRKNMHIARNEGLKKSLKEDRVAAIRRSKI